MRPVLLTLTLLAAANPAVADLTADVRCREIGFSKAAEARDLDAFRSFIDADARFVASDVRRGVDEIAAAWAPFFAADGPAIRWRPSIVEVLEDGRLALSRGPYRVIAVNAEGETVEYWGTFNSVWRLDNDGDWRVVFDAGSPAESPPDEPTQALLNTEDDCP
ncbi:MAG: nuclear transport factor 2 family protein [Woeseiaceae bacterium]|nr:nuclear transport factor 2 family protein [Woeseiaceae bacterium]